MKKFSVVVSFTPLIERTVVVEASSKTLATLEAMRYCQENPPTYIESAKQIDHDWDACCPLPCNYAITDCQEAAEDTDIEVSLSDKEED